LKIPFCDNDLPLSSRPDVLVFQTPPLDSDTVVAGMVTVDLWISSSAPDTDFTAKLVDVAPGNKDFPDGFAMNLEDRIVRVRLSPDRTKPQLLQPGEVRKVSIDLLGVAKPVQGGPSHSPGYFQQQFPVLRRQLEHGRASRLPDAYGHRDEHRLSRQRSSIPHQPSDSSGFSDDNTGGRVEWNAGRELAVGS